MEQSAHTPTNDPTFRGKKVNSLELGLELETFTKGYVVNRLRLRTGKLPRGASPLVEKHLFKELHSTHPPTHKSLSTSDLMYFLVAQLGPTN